MRINFEKYQGTGNDFILIDDSKGSFPKTDKALIERLCNRNYGIGSDGLMLISYSKHADFEMVFFNPDASKSLCGNGSRCSVHYAKTLGLAKKSGQLITTDGSHDYRINEDETISIRMNDVQDFEQIDGNWFINTGSPHLMVVSPNVDLINIKCDGSALRCMDEFKGQGGTNVNFLEEVSPEYFKIRTYERGVEDETLSCGTGVTAAALAMALENKAEARASFNTKGGVLKVDFRRENGIFTNIWLTGPVKHVFSGEIDA